MYKVFLVDDEPFITEGLMDVIDWQEMNLEVAGDAENGAEALRKLQHMHVDLLITDISMPEMNGLELIRQVREVLPDLKVIVLSGYNEFNYLKEGMRLGIENYLLKPINLEELQLTLATTVSKLDAHQAGLALRPHDIRVLRENIMYRWLSRQIEPKELYERTGLLQLDIKGRAILVAAIRSGHIAEEEYGDVERMLERRAILFRDNDGDLLFVFVLDGDDTAAGKEQAVGALGKLLHQLGRPQVRVAVGAVARTADEAPESYNQAKEALEYALVSESLIIDYEQLSQRQHGGGFDLATEWPEYSKLLTMKRTDELVGKIRQDLANVRMAEGAAPRSAHNLAVEIVVRIKLELKQIKQVDSPELFRTGLERVMRADTLEELAHAAGGVAAGAIEAMLQGDKSPIIHQVLNWIQENYREDMSLKSLGAHYNIHPVYLGQLFHKETGVAFSEYVNAYRVERAKELLKSTHLKVHEIAQKVGYWENGYFYKQFKKYVGISPTDYRGLL